MLSSSLFQERKKKHTTKIIKFLNLKINNKLNIFNIHFTTSGLSVYCNTKI